MQRKSPLHRTGHERWVRQQANDGQNLLRRLDSVALEGDGALQAHYVPYGGSGTREALRDEGEGVGMTRDEAAQAVCDGWKVRLDCWAKGWFMQMCDDNRVVDQWGQRAFLPDFNDGWELAESDGFHL